MIAPILVTTLLLAPQDAAPGNSIAPLSGELTYEQARHLLLRAGFGGTPEEIEDLRRLGVEGAVARLVDYESIPDPLPPHGVTPPVAPARQDYAALTQQERQQLRNRLRRQDRAAFQRLRGWWVERMVGSPRPLEEKMTLFWHGHFTSEYGTVRNAYLMAVQNDLFREHATGNFGELALEVSRDPAMLRYLDNNRNVRRAPNENYARELMELFTLGEGNYSERDIAEAARAFTGWTFQPRSAVFRFVSRNHDFGDKEILGHRGNFNGDDVVRILLEQPAAPRFLARKLLAWFAVEPTAEELEPYAELLRRSGYEIKPVLRALFSSQWFYSDRVRARQVKSPVMLAVSTVRSMGLRAAPGSGVLLASRCDALGQSLFNPPGVKGWEEGPAWITSSHLLARANFCRELIRRAKGRRGRGFSALHLVQTADVSGAEEIVRLLERRFLALPLAEHRRQALVEFLTGADGSEPLDLGAPDRAAAKLDECLHLLMTTPEFQIC